MSDCCHAMPPAMKMDSHPSGPITQLSSSFCKLSWSWYFIIATRTTKKNIAITRKQYWKKDEKERKQRKIERKAMKSPSLGTSSSLQTWTHSTGAAQEWSLPSTDTGTLTAELGLRQTLGNGESLSLDVYPLMSPPRCNRQFQNHGYTDGTSKVQWVKK